MTQRHVLYDVSYQNNHRFASCRQLFAHRVTGVRCLAAGPSQWLIRRSGTLRDPARSFDSFLHDLKTFLGLSQSSSAVYSALDALRL